ncbi:MAG: hypothetical protein E6R04_09145 [Spirochaetes bacterium]|nr:MAG: hypothetical protein E6R04_09145 [Spirochaetota bacterium]
MPNLPAIGDSRSKLQRIRQLFDLPLDRDSILKRFQSILELGGVQKVVVEIGHPIKVERLIRPGDESPQELPEESDFGLAMSSEVVEHLMEADQNAFSYLFSAFQFISGRKSRPRSILVADMKALKKWLSVPSMVVLSEVFGVPVRVETQVPEDVLLLIAEDVESEGGGVFSIRLVMDFQKEKK